jgi:nickel/cobalt exporter
VKGRALLALLRPTKHAHHHHDHAHHHHGHAHDHDDEAHAWGHAHAPEPADLTGRDWLKRGLTAVVAVGLRPCSGAIIVLVFAMAQGLYAAGVGAVVAMGLGTALTTSALAAVAVFAKGAALRAAAGRGQAGEWIAGGLEVLASAFVFALGLALVLGLAGGGAG